VMAFLIKNGMNANLLSAIGYGDTKPIASNDTPEGKAKNRRVELVVSGTVEVTVDDLIAAGQKELGQKNYKGALVDFLKAIESDSRSAKAYHLAGDCYLILGGKDLAVQAYVKSLKYDPENKALKDWLTQYAPNALNAPLTPIAPATGAAPANGDRVSQPAPADPKPTVTPSAAAAPDAGMPALP
jgi:tetratricopeptide (TPR) repeat protein